MADSINGYSRYIAMYKRTKQKLCHHNHDSHSKITRNFVYTFMQIINFIISSVRKI